MNHLVGTELLKMKKREERKSKKGNYHWIHMSIHVQM